MRIPAVIAVCSLLCATALTGCADKQAPVLDIPSPPSTPPAAEVSEPAEASADPATKGRIPRGALDAVLREGPFWVFRNVALEEVIKKGKFVGWRVRELPPGWDDVGLEPGDVVTKVNAMPVETPTQFWAAWTTLSVASELKVAYVRDGKSSDVSFPIDGTPNPAVASRLQQRPDQSRQRPPKRKETIVIKGTDRPLSDTRVDWTP